MISLAQLGCFDNFIDVPVKPIKEFEIYEQLAADMTHGIVMPRNQEGYDVLAEGYKYQVKYCYEIEGYRQWVFHFRLSKFKDFTPDFCIFYGIQIYNKKRNSESLYLNCFLIPFEKILENMSFGHNSKTEGKINATTGNRSWIWDWKLTNDNYESFIARRNELDRYRQLLLICDNAR